MKFVLKRNGVREPFNEEKFNSFVSWLCADDPRMTETLVTSISWPEQVAISTDRMLRKVIDVAEVLTGVSETRWVQVANRALLLQTIKASGFYFKKYGVKGEVLDTSLFLSKFPMFFEDTRFVNPSAVIMKHYDAFTHCLRVGEDWDADISETQTIITRFCLTDNSTFKETPLLLTFRNSFNDSVGFDGNFDIQLFQRMFKHTIEKDYSRSTPDRTNGGRASGNFSSCFIGYVANSSDGIHKALHSADTASKYMGGCGQYFGDISGKGYTLKNSDGKTSGVVSTMRLFQEGMILFNQSGTRPGALNVTLPWWHYDVDDFIWSTSMTGTEENRTRKLKTTLKVDQTFFDICDSDEEYFQAICPGHMEDKNPDLLSSMKYGETSWYTHVLAKTNTRRKPIHIQTFLDDWVDNAMSTGKLHTLFGDNVQKFSQPYVRSLGTNLCTEIHQMSSENTTSMCILGSINLVNFLNATSEQRKQSCTDMVHKLNNLIDTHNYRVPNTEEVTRKYRMLGIGVNNYAKMLAQLRLKFTDEESADVTQKMFSELYLYITQASADASRGFFKEYIVPPESHVSAGLLPEDYHLRKEWLEVQEQIKKTGIRNGLLSAIAPTATSSRAIGATESIEPVTAPIYRTEGRGSFTSVVTHDKSMRGALQVLDDVPNRNLLRLVGIMQCFIDQGISVDLHYNRNDYPDGLVPRNMIYQDIRYAHSIGIKAIYYTKGEEREVTCAGCV